MMVRHIAIHGAAGRMGKRLVALGSIDPEVAIAAALEAPGSADLGKDAGVVAGIAPIGVPLACTLDEPADVVIDFSVPEGAEAIAELCLARELPLVMATTGLSDAVQRLLREASERIAIVWAPNMSLAVNLTMKLAAMAAEALKDCSGRADVEIIERHHRFKQDAPSGTALKFGETIAGIMGQTEHVHGRHGRPGQRPSHEIGYHALRVGDNPGEHTVVFGLLGESIELTVRASNRDGYARGALAAAKFLPGKPPGIYSMYDVLFPKP